MVVQSCTIQIRLTRDQKSNIEMNAKNRGFKSLSGYLRFIALDHNILLEKKIYEIYNHILGTNGGRKSKFKKLKIPEFNVTPNHQGNLRNT